MSERDRDIKWAQMLKDGHEAFEKSMQRQSLLLRGGGYIAVIAYVGLMLLTLSEGPETGRLETTLLVSLVTTIFIFGVWGYFKFASNPELGGWRKRT